MKVYQPWRPKVEGSKLKAESLPAEGGQKKNNEYQAFIEKGENGFR